MFGKREEQQLYEYLRNKVENNVNVNESVRRFKLTESVDNLHQYPCNMDLTHLASLETAK